jgi:epidermal growth factor receptor substrate 15
VYLRILVITLGTISPVCAVASDTLLPQIGQTFDLLLMAAAGLVAVLLVYCKILLTRQARLLAKQQSQLSQQQAHWQHVKIGLLQVNDLGQVIFVNKMAASFLGSNEQALLDRYLVDIVDPSATDLINQGLHTQQYAVVQIYMQASKRFLQLNFSARGSTSRTEHAHYQVISVADVSIFRHQLEQQSQELNYFERALDNSAIGRLKIDLVHQQFTADSLFAQMLKQSDFSGDLTQLDARVDKGDLFNWQQALDRAKIDHQFDISCRFSLVDPAVVAHQGTAPRDSSGQHCVGLRLVGLSRQKNAQEESSVFECLVHNLSAIDTQKTLYETSQQQLNCLLSASSSAIYFLDNDSNLINCNNEFERLFKITLSNAKPQSILESGVLPEAISNLHVKSQQRFGSGHLPHNIQLQLTLAPGDARNFQLTLKHYRDEHNNLAGVIGLLQDTTELHQTKVTLAHERAHFTSILDLAPISMLTIDGNDQVVAANIAMIDRLGISEKELQKDSFYQLFCDTSRAVTAAKEIQGTARLRGFHVNLKGKNGQPHPSELHVDLLHKDKQQYLCWISDRSAEQYQQDKFDSLLQHSSMPMAILAQQGFTQLNPAACTFFKVQDQQQMFGLMPSSVSLNVDEEAALELQRQINKVKLDGQAKFFQWEHQVAEHLLPCQLTLVPMYKGQESDCILCIWMDFRDLQEADEARVQALNLHEAAAQQVAVKQQLLNSSQNKLASKSKNLLDTQSQLQVAQQDLSHQENAFSRLQQQHQSVTVNLQQLQSQYKQSCSMLKEAQDTNNELNIQLEDSANKVTGLQAQRTQISDALQHSEKRYRKTQQELAESELNSQKLLEKQQNQQQKMQSFEQEIAALKGSIHNKDQQIIQVAAQIEGLQSQLVSSDDSSDKLRQLLEEQRKASVQAQEQRRTVEQSYKIAQSDLLAKVRHVEHLQNEMQKFEEMSNQQKGDMQQQQQLLLKELQEKQTQLQQTQAVLEATKQAVDQGQETKDKQQKRLDKLYKELAEMESQSLEQTQTLAKGDQARQEQQQKIYQELQQKQEQLQATEQILSQSKQQTANEKAQKEQQQMLFEKLQFELDEMEQLSALQQQQMAESAQQSGLAQQALKEEVEAKRQQLQDKQDKLDSFKHQAELDKLSSLEQQQKLEQLTVELGDVENRATKQREMLAGSDDQWRKHHGDIEQQKTQLQQALVDAQQQNVSLQSKLQGKLVRLQHAESQVSKTQTGEVKLQQELTDARTQAEQLQYKLQQQEQQEQQLQSQLVKQQQSLKGSEQNIHSLHSKQAELTNKLHEVQQKYAHSKQSVSAQHSDHNKLTEQLGNLEQQLKSSQGQLEDKEAALLQAQQLLENNQQHLSEQEDALLVAHKKELQQAQKQQPKENDGRQLAINQWGMPENPELWFDLLAYLKIQNSQQPLSVALSDLMEELETSIAGTDQAVEEEDVTKIASCARQLGVLANKVNSEALTDLVTRLQMHCQQGLIDNISIAWPTVKRSINNTLKVIHSHLHTSQ